ncbi:MAG: glycogen phosphorylase, partial [Acidobacteriaceae bacterium]|nr:glycogen phosphorylase [Acidobacteriaceae bacterium]
MTPQTLFTSRLPYSLENQGQSRLVAYFSMEIAITPAIPTYSGGLGVLAGDTLRAAADMRLPLVAVT